MSENYKQERYVKLPNFTIRTVGELKNFIKENIKLSDEELFEHTKKYSSLAVDSTEYIKIFIKTFKRTYKIEKLLNEKYDV